MKTMNTASSDPRNDKDDKDADTPRGNQNLGIHPWAMGFASKYRESFGL
jgi:hypothetical protein